MKKDKLIELLVVRGVATREQLQSKYVHDLEQMLDDSNLAQIRAETQRRVATDPRVIAAEQQNRILDENLAFTHIFRTPINGRVLIDNEANRNFLRSQVDEIEGDQISPAWFRKILAENPALANQLSWQSADILNPVKRKQAIAAEAEKDREVFSTFAKANGFSLIEANYNLVRVVLNPGYDQYALVQAVQDGRLRLAPASEEIEQWRREDAEQRQEWLINQASPEQLRAASRQEAEERRIQAQQEFVREQDEAGRKRAAESGKPQLPEVNSLTGEKLDATFFNKLSATNRQEFRRYVGFYGGNQIVDRMRGIR